MSSNRSYKKKLKNYIKTEFHQNGNLTRVHDAQIDNILKTGSKILDKYIKRNRILHIKHNEIKNKNETFTAGYKPILQYRDNQNYLENQFHDQLLPYKNKGYKIPDLTTKNNAIKYSPLILKTQPDIDKFYLQDLFNINKKKEIKQDLMFISKSLLPKNINTDEEDDEKEGIKAITFLEKCNEFINNRFNYIKKGKKYKSVSLNDWFQKDLFRNKSLNLKDDKEDSNIINNYETFILGPNEKQKKIPLKKEIRQLKKENSELKQRVENLTWLSLSDENSFNSKNNSSKIKIISSPKKNQRRNNVLIINNKKMQTKSNTFNENKVTSNDVKVIFTKKIIDNMKNYLLSSSATRRNKKLCKKILNRKLLLNVIPIKKKDIKLSKDKIDKISLSSKKKKSYKKLEENNGKEYLLTSLRSNKSKYRELCRNNININLKMNHEDFINKDKNKQNDIDIKNNENKTMTNFKINNLYEMSLDRNMYEKDFNSFRNKDPSSLFSLINISKKPFNKKEILSLYKWTYNKKIISKNDAFNKLDKELYNGLLKSDLV